MLRVDSWLDVASLENMEEDHSFLFLKKNLMKIFFFFFWIWKTWIFQRNLKFWIFFFFLKNFGNLEFFKELKILMDFFYFFYFWKQPKKYEPNAPSPKALFENFLLFFFKDLERIDFFFFFWKTYPLNENNFGWKLMQIAG